MGFFANKEIEVIQLFREDGLKEPEIAQLTGLTLLEVHTILDQFENGEFDYDGEEE